MAIITFDKIGNVFTQKVNEYLKRGYVVNLSTMSGTQGETARIDLIQPKDSKKIIRIRVESYWAEFNSITSIFVEEHEKKSEFCETLWNGKGDLIEEIKFYEVSNKKGKKIYADDLNEFNKIKEKQISRMKGNSINFVKLNPAKVVKVIKKFYGFKTIRPKDIISVEKISKNGILYIVHVNKNNKIVQVFLTPKR